MIVRSNGAQTPTNPEEMMVLLRREAAAAENLTIGAAAFEAMAAATIPINPVTKAKISEARALLTAAALVVAEIPGTYAVENNVS